jgi:hypothetical protein
VKIYSGNHLLRTTSLTPWSKFFPQNFIAAEIFNKSLVVCNEIPPPRVPRSRSTATYAEHYLYHTLLTFVSYSLQIHLKRDILPSRFQTKRLYAFLNFQMPGYNGPELSTTMCDFRLSEKLFKTQVVMDIKSSDTASNRLASYQTPSWMLSTMSSRFPLGKFMSLMWGSTKIFGDLFTFVSLIHGQYCCSVHILYVCVADPWEVLL